MYRCVDQNKAENSVSTNNYILMIVIIMLTMRIVQWCRIRSRL